MKRICIVLCLALWMAACGSDDNPADAGGSPIVNETFTLAGGNFRSFSFTINTDTQRNVFVQGEFSVESGSIELAVMNEANFQAWQEGRSPTVLYSPGLTPRASFRLPIDSSGTFYLVFSNVRQSEARVIKAEIFLFSVTEDEDL